MSRLDPSMHRGANRSQSGDRGVREDQQQVEVRAPGDEVAPGRRAVQDERDQSRSRRLVEAGGGRFPFGGPTAGHRSQAAVPTSGHQTRPGAPPPLKPPPPPNPPKPPPPPPNPPPPNPPL